MFVVKPESNSSWEKRSAKSSDRMPGCFLAIVNIGLLSNQEIKEEISKGKS